MTGGKPRRLIHPPSALNAFPCASLDPPGLIRYNWRVRGPKGGIRLSPDRLIFGLVPWYSFLIVCGMILAILLAGLEEKRLGLPKDTVLDIALLVIPFGVIGARLYYVVFSWQDYAADPLRILRIWEGGLAIYGGVIAGVIVLFAYSRIKKIPFPALCDIVAPGLALAQGIGRWGNFFNREAYGALVTDPSWQFFPAAVRIGEEWHMATFFYESMADLAVFAGLWLTRKRRTRQGDGFLCYLLFYGSARLIIEGLRTDSLYGFIEGLRVSQMLSVFMAAAVCVVCAFRAKPAARWFAALPAAGLTALLIVFSRTAELAPRTITCAAFSAAAIAGCALLHAFEKRRPADAVDSAE